MRPALAFLLGSGVFGFTDPFIGTVAAACVGILVTAFFAHELRLIGREADHG